MHVTYVVSNEVTGKMVHGYMTYTECAPKRQQFYLAPACLKQKLLFCRSHGTDIDEKKKKKKKKKKRIKKGKKRKRKKKEDLICL